MWMLWAVLSLCNCAQVLLLCIVTMYIFYMQPRKNSCCDPKPNGSLNTQYFDWTKLNTDCQTLFSTTHRNLRRNPSLWKTARKQRGMIVECIFRLNNPNTDGRDRSWSDVAPHPLKMERSWPNGHSIVYFHCSHGYLRLALVSKQFHENTLLGGKAGVVFESHISAHVIIIGMYE